MPQQAAKITHLCMKLVIWFPSSGKSELSLNSIMFSIPFLTRENNASSALILVNYITWTIVEASSSERVAKEKSSS